MRSSDGHAIIDIDKSSLIAIFHYDVTICLKLDSNCQLKSLYYSFRA